MGSIESASSVVANQRPFISLLAPDGSVEDPRYFRNTPDHLALYGKFSSGAVLSMAMRGGTPFPGTSALDWKIYGSKGEIRVTSQQMLLNLGSPVVDLSVYDFESGRVEKIDLGKDEWQHLPLVARNVARLYEAIANGDTSVVCDFEEAAQRHRFIQEFVENGEWRYSRSKSRYDLELKSSSLTSMANPGHAELKLVLFGIVDVKGDILRGGVSSEALWR